MSDDKGAFKNHHSLLASLGYAYDRWGFFAMPEEGTRERFGPKFGIGDLIWVCAHKSQ